MLFRGLILSWPILLLCSISLFTKAADLALSRETSKANNQFALDAYKRLASSSDNIFFSPLSLSTAMLMVYEGARDTTASEIREVFHFDPVIKNNRTSYSQLNALFNKKHVPYKLYLANALWLQTGMSILHDYRDPLKRYYQSAIKDVDFVTMTEVARKEINQWVEARTNSKIKNLVPVGAINSSTRLVLTNVIYFKGDWSTQFNSENTQKEPFTKNDGVAVDVDMMGMYDFTARFNYAEDSDAQIAMLLL